MSLYDYVIVGAGCVLAARLSEDPGTHVLLLEAGPPDDAPEIARPAAFPTLPQGPFAWAGETAPQRHAGSRRIAWPHGRTLGGGSSINGMVYVRGNPADYDGWRDEHGRSGGRPARAISAVRGSRDHTWPQPRVPRRGGGPRRADPLRSRAALAPLNDPAIVASLDRRAPSASRTSSVMPARRRRHRLR